MSKYYILMIILLFQLCLSTGCKKQEKSINPLLQHHLNILNSFEPKKYLNEYFEKILISLESRDEGIMISLFSENIQKNDVDLLDDVQYLFDFYKGKTIKKSEIQGPMKETHNNHGSKKSVCSCYYEVSTDQEEYLVFFKVCDIDSENENNVGLQMLQVIRLEDKDRLFDWGTGDSDCMGIYRPQ